MSAARYTFFSELFQRELTAVLTLPDRRADGSDCLKAVLLFSPVGRESDWWLRAFPLERFGKPPYEMASVSLPEWILRESDERLEQFICGECGQLAAMFKLRFCAAESASGIDTPKECILAEYCGQLYQGITDPLAYAENIARK